VKLKNICNLIDYLKIKKWWGEIEKKYIMLKNGGVKLKKNI
jgi:hypothetical protein